MMALHSLKRRLQFAGPAMLAAGLLLAAAQPAAATSMKACGASYKAAKAAGTLNGADWKTYRATQCSSTAATPAAATPVAATPAAPATPAAAAVPPPVPAATTAPAKTAVAKTAPVPATAAAAPVAAGNAVFPSKVDPKYATLKAGAARRKTCDDQYKANKANGGNGSLPWNQKGGGYYSACNAHLKAL